MSEAASILTDYFRSTGMSGTPEDAAQQMQVTLLMQWVDHLDYVLREEEVDSARRLRIIRSFIYGAVPLRADAQLRQAISADHARHLANCTAGMRLP